MRGSLSEACKPRERRPGLGDCKVRGGLWYNARLMHKQFIRLYQNLDFDVVKEHTLEYGALSGVCSKCKELNIKLDALFCPKCATPFKYIAFQNVREHLPKLLRLSSERSALQFIDHQDFKRIEGEQKARSIFG
jgi:hypothetical protein